MSLSLSQWNKFKDWTPEELEEFDTLVKQAQYETWSDEGMGDSDRNSAMSKLAAIAIEIAEKKSNSDNT